jgi:hypothetical protein
MDNTVQPDNPATVLERVRRFLHLLLLLGFIGTGAELLLLNHLEETLQIVPLALLGFGVLVLGWHLLAHHRASILVLRWLMLLFLLSGFVGIVLHYKGNVEFALELHPSLSGLELFWKALRGGIPIFGPAVMIELGLLGLISTYHHPQLTNNRRGV